MKLLMNKLTIPALLLGVVMIAGAFAFMPVQEASTVHTIVQDTTIRATNTLVAVNWEDTADDATADQLLLTCTGVALVHEISFEDDGSLDSVNDDISLVIDPDGANAAFGTTTSLDIFAGVAPEDEASLLATNGLTDGITLIAGGTISLTLVQDGADGNDENPSVSAVYTSQGTCAWTQE